MSLATHYHAAWGICVASLLACPLASAQAPVSADVNIADELSQAQAALNRGTLDSEVITHQQRAIDALRALLMSRGVEPISEETTVNGHQATPSEDADGASVSGSEGQGGQPGDSTDAGTPTSTDVAPTPIVVDQQRRQLADSVWGHLPAVERRELLRNFSERFLPKYESQVSEYFKRLAEQSAEKPSP